MSQHDDPSMHDVPAPSEITERSEWAFEHCQVHEVKHDTRILPVRTYTIQVEGPSRGRVKLLKVIHLQVCDQVATQLGLLPLP